MRYVADAKAPMALTMFFGMTLETTLVGQDVGNSIGPGTGVWVSVLSA